MPPTHAWPPVSALLQKHTDARWRRRPVPRELEQAVQQRLAQIGDQSARSIEWQAHQARFGSISVHLTLMDAPRTVLAEVDDEGWLIHVSVGTPELMDAESLEVGLRVVATIDKVLRKVAADLGQPTPPALPRAKREREWLDSGGHRPTPIRIGPARVRAQAEPLTVEKAWLLVEGRASETAERGADPGTVAGALRLLLGTVDAEALRRSAEAVLGKLSPDAWEAVRAWLLLQGKAAVDRVSADPAALRSLLESTDEDAFATAEAVLYPARD